MAATRRRRRKFGRAGGSKLGFWTLAFIILLLGGYVGVIEYSRPHVSGREIRVDTFVDLVERGRIQRARILDVDNIVVGTYLDDQNRPVAYNAPWLKGQAGGIPLLGVLLENRVPTEIDQQNSKRVAEMASLILPGLILAVLFLYFIVSFRRGSGLFGLRSGAKRIGMEGTDVTFADVAGQDAAVTELKEIRDFLADPERFTRLGATVPKGILLYGPPGCGKTLLAQAVAGESGAAFYSISGSDFVELYVGVGAARVRDLFKEARENAPAIIFIDELDSVGRRRTGGNLAAGGREEQEQALNQILAEMDGFSPLNGIILIGATNRPDILDPALLRPGRFDRTVALERPDEDGRLAILSVHAQDVPIDARVDLSEIARRAIGLSGADLAGLMNEAALLAARSSRDSVAQSDLEIALERVLEAPERQRRLSMRDRTFGRTTGGEARATFADVAGVEEAIEELSEVREYLVDPERYVALGARPPRGFLLVGPPGCGKTLMARAVAGEANAAFFSVGSTELVEVLVGEGAARVRDLFAEARAAAPSIVFLDEIDAIGARRGVSLDAGREREQTLNQILIELDGFDARAGVTVLAATNRPEILDEALVRPGRFDRTITLGLPDRRARRAILEVHAKGKRLEPGTDLEVVAGLTQGFSGADLANVMNEAALLAGRRRLTEISSGLIEEAISRVGGGIARGRILSADERAMVAYHEAGHALVSRALPGAHVAHKISIVARGQMLGAQWNVDRGDQALFPRSALVDRMAGLLGGRAAEEMVFGEPASGAADDLRQVTALARWMVCDLGMGDTLGPRVFSQGTEADGRLMGYSEDAARLIDEEVSRLLDEAYGRAREVLSSSGEGLHRVAKALLERETLSAAEIDVIVRSPEQAQERRGDGGWRAFARRA